MFINLGGGSYVNVTIYDGEVRVDIRKWYTSTTDDVLKVAWRALYFSSLAYGIAVSVTLDPIIPSITNKSIIVFFKLLIIFLNISNNLCYDVYSLTL